MKEFKIGQKVWFEYGYGIYRGKVLAVLDERRVLVRSLNLAVGRQVRSIGEVFPR